MTFKQNLRGKQKFLFKGVHNPPYLKMAPGLSGTKMAII